jgi:hypothetical protein
MLRTATTFLVFSVAAYLAYREWATYPSLIPDQRAQRRIAAIARRRGISREAAHLQWANRRLQWTRFRYLVRG